jgi:hypothetical protein
MTLKPFVIRSVAIGCLLLLSACFSKITLENYNKINEGMSLSEVSQILGEPSTSSSVNLGPISGTSTEWRGENGEVIAIQFVNNKVKLKNFSK